MSPLHIHVAGCTPQLWKNGGGVTRELLAWPNAHEWQLRISVADITQNGAFSSFTDVQRSFAVIEGAGVRLKFTNRLEVVTQDSEPLQFEGAEAPYCELLDGSTRDLNVMCKTGRKIKLDKAYSSEEKSCCGLFLIESQSLEWHEQATLMQAPNSQNVSAHTKQHIGWWIDFL